MSFLILPLVLLMTLAPTPAAPASVLGEFSQFSKVVNKQVSLAAADGTVSEGVVTASGPTR